MLDQHVMLLEELTPRMISEISKGATIKFVFPYHSFILMLTPSENPHIGVTVLTVLRYALLGL